MKEVTTVALSDMTKGGVKVDINEVIERRWEERAKQQDEVRRRMRTGWKTDPSMLDEYFRSVVTNWKSYRGPKTEKIVCKMYGIYKQAVFGDCNVSNTHEMLSLPSKKWIEWNSRKGMSKDESKRRFITYCAEIDPMLIDIMPNEMPPEGFPSDNKGIPICAKCNTVVGCSRPLLNEHFENLRRQLFERIELQDPVNLRSWMVNALHTQRCIWGVHKPVSRVEANKFSEWFNRTENRGYLSYDSKNLVLMLQDLLKLLYEILQDMQANKEAHSIDEVNAQIMKVYGIDRYYLEFTGEPFVFEEECTRDDEICNKRREGDGGRNHKHPVEIAPPEVDYSPFDEAITLRKKCQELGINPATGIQPDIEKRCEMYRTKIKDYELAQAEMVAARKRNEERSAHLPALKQKIKNVSGDLLLKHMITACNDNDKLKILSLGKRGCSCNVETPRGMRPLTVVQTQSPSNEELAQLLKYRGADVNSVNKYGMSALMLACRMKDTKTILFYMETAGADEAVSEGTRGTGKTALHYCAIHNCEEAAKIIFDNVSKLNDVMRSIKFIDAQDSFGNTPLITAAKVGNGIMCRALLQLGANPIIKNLAKRTAATEARENRFLYLAEWLSKKVSSGVSGVETFNDVQFEKTVRYQTMQLLSMVSAFARATLNVLLGRPTGSLFGTPSQTKEYIISNGEYGRKDQQRLVNSYWKFVLNKQNIEIPDVIIPFLEEMRSNMDDMMEILRQGEAYPSSEMSEKPIPWTPLMCACCLNDLRSIRRLKQWGADLDHQNRHGTTALMLCAQLHNIDALTELLVLGARTDVLDSEGFSAMAYASSLPLPHDLQRSVVHVLCDGEQGSGSKGYRADEVLKLALTCTPEELKAKVQANKDVVAREFTSKSKPHLKLLEKQGLSTVDTMADLELALQRVHQEDAARDNIAKEIEALQDNHSISIGRGSASIDSLLRFDRAESTHDGSVSTVSFVGAHDMSDLLLPAADEREHENEVFSDSSEELRCPICTLKIPCNHFYSKSAHDDYILRKKTGKRNFADGSAAGYEKNIKKREAQIHRNRITNNVFNREGMKVLREAELDDRKTNRSDRYLQYLKTDKKHPPGENGGREASQDQQAPPPSLMPALLELEDSIPLNPYANANATIITDAPPGGENLLLAPPAAAINTTSKNEHHVSLDLDNNSECTGMSTDSASASLVSTITEPSVLLDTSASMTDGSDRVGGEGCKKECNRHDSELDVFVEKQYEDDNNSTTNSRPEDEITHVKGAVEKEKICGSEHEATKELEAPLVTTDSGSSTEGMAKDTSSDHVDKNKNNEHEEKYINIDADVHEYYQFTAPLPLSSANPSRSVLAKTYKSARKRVQAEKHRVKKFQANKRVIKFLVNDEVLDGGVGATDVKVSDVSVSSYEESLNSDFISRVDVNLDDDDDDDDDVEEEGQERGGKLSTALIDSERAAMEEAHKMLTGEKNVDEDKDASLKKFGENPVAISKRSVSMFTRRYRDAVLLDTKKTVDQQSSSTTASTVTNTISTVSDSTEQKKVDTAQNTKFLATQSEHRFYFSGWIFSGLFSLDVAKKPIDTVCMDSDNWRNCLGQLNDSFKKQWMPDFLRMECLVDMESWKVCTKQCSTCMIGFVRCRANATVLEDDALIKDVCLACFSRKKLYDSVVKSIPRSARKMFLFEWPFHVRDNSAETFSDDDRKAMIMKFLRGYSAVAAVKVDDTNFDPSRIMEGRIVTDTLQMSEVSDEAPPTDPAQVQKELIANYYKTSKARDEAKHFMAMVKTGEIAPIVIEEENKANLFEKKKRVYAGGRKILDAEEMQVKSSSLTDRYTRLERAKIQPSELPLLHVLLSNGNYEEVERMCRICVALEEYGGEEGVGYVVTLAVLQGEMYKLLGLWVLALAVYIDATDLLVSRLGFDDRLCVSAFCNIDLIFRRLDMPAAGKLYISSLIARIKKHSFTDNLRKSENIDAILARYSQVLRHDQVLSSFTTDLEQVCALLSPATARDRELWQMGEQVYGIGSLMKLMTSTSTEALIAKENFIDYCAAKKSFQDDEKNAQYFPFVKFCDDCLKLWNCTSDELYRLLAQRLIKKYLSARTDMPVAEVYENIVTDDNHEKIQLFLKEGSLVQPEIFNPILEFCLSSLLRPYRAFIGTSMGEAVRVHMLGEDANAEFMHVVVVLIQNQWRCCRARRRVKALWQEQRQ